MCTTYIRYYSTRYVKNIQNRDIAVGYHIQTTQLRKKTSVVFKWSYFQLHTSEELIKRKCKLWQLEYSL